MYAPPSRRRTQPFCVVSVSVSRTPSAVQWYSHIIAATFLILSLSLSPSLSFLQVEKYKMPLYKATGRFWVALDLKDFVSDSYSIVSGSSRARVKKSQTTDDSGVSEAGEGKRSGPAWGVVAISNRESSEAAAKQALSLSLSLPQQQQQSLPLSLAGPIPDLNVTVPVSVPPSPSGVVTATGARSEGDFSVPVGVSSKRRKLEDGGHLALDPDTQARDEGQGQGQGLTGEKKAGGTGLGTGAGVGEGGFAMPTGLGVSSKRVSLSVGGRKEKDLSVEKDSEKDKERESGGPFERRLLYEDSVRHTTLGLDLSLGHIHKFVGHRYDHDLYTQVSGGEVIEAEA